MREKQRESTGRGPVLAVVLLAVVALVAGWSVASGQEGEPVYSAFNAANRANPYFVGPDGVRDTADDLPYVATNAAAQAAGYALAAQGARPEPTRGGSAGGPKTPDHLHRHQRSGRRQRRQPALGGQLSQHQ